MGNNSPWNWMLNEPCFIHFQTQSQLESCVLFHSAWTLKNNESKSIGFYYSYVRQYCGL